MNAQTKASSEPFYVTTPIYYVNSRPHIGHAYTTIIADIMKRYYDLTGHETYFLTGTDEHGDKIFKSASAQDIEPQQFTDNISQEFRDLLPKINAHPNDFIRTTEERHKSVVQEILQKVYDQGDIYHGEYSGMYCVGCERFLGDDELVEGLCPDHQKAPEKITEKNYFFKMSKYWDKLKQHVNDYPDFIRPESYRKEVLGLLREKPQDLCISRPKDRLTWGIELPFDKDYVTYVWFDALINYISALEYPKGSKFQKYWPQVHHIIAKDILKPHCIYWPTMLFSMGATLPKHICIHGYWLMGDNKISKSTGNTVAPLDYIKEYGLDSLRYFLMRAMKFGRDAHFSFEEFATTCNADLANKIGNLYSRLSGLLRKYHDSKIPPMLSPSPYLSEETLLDETRRNLSKHIHGSMRDLELQQVTQEIIKYAEQLNKYLDVVKPWVLIKKEEEKENALHALRVGLEGVRIIYSSLWPVMPETVEKVFTELLGGFNMKELKNSLENGTYLHENHTLPEKVTGFPRIDMT